MNANATVPVEPANDVRNVISEMRNLAPTCENDWCDMLNEWAKRLDAAAPQPEATQEVDGDGVANCAECGAFLEHVRPGKHQHPTCSQTRNPQPVDLGQFREADVAKTVDFDGYKLSVMADGSVMVSQGARLVVLIDRQPGGASLWITRGPNGRTMELALAVILDQAERVAAYGMNGVAANLREAHEDIAALRGGQPS